MTTFIFMILFAVVVLGSVRLRKYLGFQDNYMSLENTTAVKGIFVLIVFLSHVAGYVDFSSKLDAPFRFFPELLGQMMVVPFLFYSGFGIMESIAKKGQDYVRTIPTKRFLKVLVHFDIAILLYTVLNLALGHPFSLKEFLLSLVVLDEQGGGNWFIFASLIMYVFTYISFTIFRRHKTLGAFGVLGCTGLMVILFGTFKLKPEYWYDTVFFFPLGMFWSLWRTPIEQQLKKIHLWLPAFMLCVCGFLTMRFLLRPTNYIMYQIEYFLFGASLILLTMRVNLSGKVLDWLGKHIFSIYILQRLPMRIFAAAGITNPSIYFIVTFTSTILIAWIFDILLGKLDNVLFAKKETALCK